MTAATKTAPDKAAASAAVEGLFSIISLKQLVESKTNPRRHFAGLDELTDSVKTHGVLTPLLVRPTVWDAPVNGKAEPEYEIIAGARRYRAAKAAKLETVPVRILELDDTKALEFQVIENLQRADVHPLDEALGYKHLLETAKYDVAALAEKVGKSERYIYQRIQLATLIPEAQKAFFEDKLTASHAALICRLQPAQQKQALKNSGPETSVRDLNRWIEWNVHLDLGKVAFPTDDDGKVKSSGLVPGAVACHDCPKRLGANPALFGDVKNGETCTDPQCYHAKEQAFVQIQLQAHPGAPELAVGYYSEHDKKRLGSALEGWNPIGGKKCKDTVEGVITRVQQHSEGRLGQVLKVCTNKRCKTHNPHGSSSHSSAPTPAEKARRDREKLESSVREDVDRQIVRTVWNKVVAVKLGNVKAIEPILRAIAVFVDENGYGRDCEEARVLAFGKDGGPASIDKAVAKLKAPKLLAFIAGSTLGNDMLAPKQYDDVLAWAGLNFKKLMADAVAKLPKKGTCRVCGCTEKKACRVKTIPGSNATQSCSWADETKTLCSNPKCVAAAKQEKAA